MKFVSGFTPYGDVPLLAAGFGHILDQTLARQAQKLVEIAIESGVAEEDAVALIVWNLLRSACTFIGFETLEQDAPFPRAEFDRLVTEIVDDIASKSGRNWRAQA